MCSSDLGVGLDPKSALFGGLAEDTAGHRDLGGSYFDNGPGKGLIVFGLALGLASVAGLLQAGIFLRPGAHREEGSRNNQPSRETEPHS